MQEVEDKAKINGKDTGDAAQASQIVEAMGPLDGAASDQGNIGQSQLESKKDEQESKEDEANDKSKEENAEDLKEEEQEGANIKAFFFSKTLHDITDQLKEKGIKPCEQDQIVAVS